ncbi:MAG TPA: hypothetical protein VMJ10_26775 [Kofleriaceae bacterium]|nr:hypothetical protein [Kofleriaceae bacterium]
MSYRDDVDALAARHAALDAQAAEATRQRDDAARLLAEARTRASLPVLDNLRIASPCSESWDEMTGDDRVRACAKCNQNVYNLTAMTRDEAEALIVSRAGQLCARYYQRTDGTILLADCTIGVRNKRRRRWIAAAIGATAGLASGVGIYKKTRPEPAAEVIGAIPTVAVPQVPQDGPHGHWIAGGMSPPAALAPNTPNARPVVRPQPRPIAARPGRGNAR